jgi:predicted phosphodiesterase
MKKGIRMKVDFISDIHLDFHIKETDPNREKLKYLIEDFCSINGFDGGDVLIIAGDLGHYYGQDTMFLKYVNTLYRHVILVRGNHDMYLISKSQQQKYLFNSMNRVLEMKKFCREEGIHYLDGNTIVIDGFSFGGVGMSWDTSFIKHLTGKTEPKYSVIEMFNNSMNDSRLIYGGSDHTLMNQMYRRVHKQSWDPYDYFAEEYAKLKKIEPVDVMISHYSPIIPPNLDPRYANSLTSTFYYFDGEEEVKRIGAKVWIFGHTHTPYDFEEYGTRFLCSPLGYPGENPYATVNHFLLT